MNHKKNHKAEVAVNDRSTALNIISWMFGIVAFAIGVVNTFWGNDPGFGIFIILLSFVYFLQINDILKKMTGFTITVTGIRVTKSSWVSLFCGQQWAWVNYSIR
jgi:hypothetical protein